MKGESLSSNGNNVVPLRRQVHNEEFELPADIAGQVIGGVRMQLGQMSLEQLEGIQNALAGKIAVTLGEMTVVEVFIDLKTGNGPLGAA